MRKSLIVLIGLLALWVGSVGTIVTPEVVLVDPTADLQDAVDNLDATTGGEIRLGPGTFQLSSTLRLDRPVKLVGSGVYSTYIEMDNPDSTIVEVRAGAVVIRDLTLTVNASAQGAGTGIGLKLTNPSASAIRDHIFENISIYSTGSWGIKICGLGVLEAPDASTGDIVAPQFNNIVSYNAQSGGSLYIGLGVAAPHFSDCAFVASGYTPAGTYSWKWQAVIPAYADYPDTAALQLGHVFLFGATATTFRNCSFELAGTADTPVLTLEDVYGVRFEGCHFEVNNPRAQPLVTLSASQNWYFRDTYVYAPADAPLKFLKTNTNPDSRCGGVIDGFLALHGSTSAALDTSDFRFNTAGDGRYRANIVLRDVNIYNTNGRGFRDVSVLQGSGTSSFPSQSVLLQNTSRRFSPPRIAADSLGNMAQLQRGQMVWVGAGTGLSGGLGKIMVVADHSSWAPIPVIPQAADTAAVRAYYTSAASIPREGDLCYTTGDHKLQIYNGTAWEALH